MIVVEAPNENYSLENESNVKLFMAGGITNCPDWQSELIDLLKIKGSLTVFNPRRNSFDLTNPAEAEKQIVWEHHHLEAADVISFWFSAGSLNPITLFELGKYIRSGRDIIIGIDPEYQRKSDVEIQSKLIGNFPTYYDIKSLAKYIIYNI